MKPVFQTKFTNLETGELGNCVAACLASLLEISIDDVFAYDPDDPKELNDKKFDEFLRKHHCVLMGYRWPSAVNKLPGVDGYLIASYELVGVNGYKHCVIHKGSELVHDPRGADKVELCPEPVYYWDIRRVSVTTYFDGANGVKRDRFCGAFVAGLIDRIGVLP